MNIGNGIKIIRKCKNISQKELANDCGVSVNALCSIESGKIFPSKRTIERISKTLNVPDSYLLIFSITGEDIPENKRILYDSLCKAIKEDLIKEKGD